MSEVVRIPALSLEYRLLQEEYRGPATVAWRAEHLNSGLAARVTMVSPPPRCSQPSLDAICLAFRRALERMGSFSAPDILPFDAAAEHEGMPCAITILPEGTLLSDAMAISEPVFVPKVMQIGSVIGHALARLHDAGLWHGYLHPANILIVGNERPALLDQLVHAAAAAAAWQEGLPVSGSIYVGVGERAFREQDPYVDVYALAAILLRIMTGSSPEKMLMEQIEKQLPQALPSSLRQDLVAALNIGPQSRPPTARTLAVHLSFDVAWLKATSELGPAKEGASEHASNGHGPVSGATVTEEGDGATGRRGDGATGRRTTDDRRRAGLRRGSWHCRDRRLRRRRGWGMRRPSLHGGQGRQRDRTPAPILCRRPSRAHLRPLPRFLPIREQRRACRRLPPGPRHPSRGRGRPVRHSFLPRWPCW